MLKNPSTSKTIFYVTIESVSNYGAEAVSASLAENVNLGNAECLDVPIYQTNLGCSTLSAAKVCQTRLACASEAQFLTQDMVAPFSTLRIDHQGGFVVTPGKSLAVVVVGFCSNSSCRDCMNVGIDLRWWETPCNSHQ